MNLFIDYGINGIDLASEYVSAYPFEPSTMKEIFKYIKGKNKNIQIVIGGAVLFPSAIYQIVDLLYCCEPGTTKSIFRR